MHIKNIVMTDIKNEGIDSNKLAVSGRQQFICKRKQLTLFFKQFLLIVPINKFKINDTNTYPKYIYWYCSMDKVDFLFHHI